MPRHIVKFDAYYSRGFLKFAPDGESAAIVGDEQATEFASADAAWDAVVEAALAMRAAINNEDKLPGWARVVCGMTVSTKRQYIIEPAKRAFEFPLRPSYEELAGAMDIFYVRSASKGWWGRKGWSSNFGWAIGFADAAEALAETENLGDRSLFKARSVFVEAKPAPGSRRCDDPIRDGIQAVCEAREIEAELDQSANARLEAAKLPRASAKSRL